MSCSSSFLSFNVAAALLWPPVFLAEFLLIAWLAKASRRAAAFTALLAGVASYVLAWPLGYWLVAGCGSGAVGRHLITAIAGNRIYPSFIGFDGLPGFTLPELTVLVATFTLATVMAETVVVRLRHQRLAGVRLLAAIAGIDLVRGLLLGLLLRG